jgi:RNA polymerase sigma-70 factor (ECF subfamily)
MTGVAKSTTMAASDVELAARGDELAFTRLVSTYNADMARIAYAICGQRSLAEDAVQSAWLICWNRLGSVRDPDRVRQWLISIAVNEARQILRRRRRADVAEIDVKLAAPVQSDPAFGLPLVDLRRVLARLSADDRALVAMRYGLGLDMTEIGAATGRSAEATRARLSRLTARLREELNR